MIDKTLIILPFIAFMSYVIKGVAGFGGAVFFVSAGSVAAGAGNAVVLSAVFETIGGAILFYRDKVWDKRLFWIPMSVSMTLGSVAGGIALRYMPGGRLNFLLGIFIFCAGIWFLAGRVKDDSKSLSDSIPAISGVGDNIFSAVSGFTSGLLGMGGPIIVYWLGRKFAKFSFRRILIPVFFFASVARLFTYISFGLFTGRIAVISIASFPAIILGVFVGAKIFGKMSEKKFSFFIGIMLIFISLYTIFK